MKGSLVAGPTKSTVAPISSFPGLADGGVSAKGVSLNSSLLVTGVASGGMGLAVVLAGCRRGLSDSGRLATSNNRVFSMGWSGVGFVDVCSGGEVTVVGGVVEVAGGGGGEVEEAWAGRRRVWSCCNCTMSFWRCERSSLFCIRRCSTRACVCECVVEVWGVCECGCMCGE